MSEPQHIRDILPAVMRDIEGRMQRQRQRGVVAAVGAFLAGESKRVKGGAKDSKAETSNLWTEQR